MKINTSIPLGNQTGHTPSSTKPDEHNQVPPVTPTNPSPSTHIELSSQHQTSDNADIDHEKVERLKAAIQQGAYESDASAIADAFIRQQEEIE